MYPKHLNSLVALLAVGCALTSASVINRDASNTSDAFHFFNECQGAFSIGTTFNGIPDSRNPKNTAISAEGRCEDAHKNIVCTYMWLNRCYNNDFNGRLVPVFNGAGNFANSCHGCYVNDPLRAGWLFCNCSMRHDETGAMGTMVQVEANLQDHLYVDARGYLTCPGNEGQQCNH